MSAAPHLAAVPELDDLIANPALAETLPLDALIRLRRLVRHLDADLDAAITGHLMRSDHRVPQPEPDRLLTATEAAAIFSVKARWLLGHADEIPGVRRLSRKVVRFSERALRRHLNGLKA